MVAIQGLIERAIQNKSTLRKVNETGPVTGNTMAKFERAAIRRMMARYVSNYTINLRELGSRLYFNLIQLLSGMMAVNGYLLLFNLMKSANTHPVG